jgi:hypothetical protein
MIYRGENRSTLRKPYPIATFFTTNLTLIDLESNPGLRDERLVPSRLKHGKADSLKKINLNYI